ncbi:hypothetical protein BHE74_00047216 [Ensete ventricosum]|nr:hypothetical protein BHE74_00047216 [Ensete ventricosum]RZS21824.1 hypothetical protein BHM03_00054510 [Ensete ventricosum]
MRSYPVRDMIMRRYDQELLGAPLWCTTTRRRAMDLRSEYHDTTEAGLRVVKRGKEATRSPEEFSYPKSKVSVRKELDSEEHHSATEADLSIANEGMQMQDNG